jgi:large subunit ribosomal protein L18e
MKPSGPTNPVTKKMIEDMRSKGYKEKNKFLLGLAERLEKSARRKPAINIAKLQRLCKDGETIIVPGKVLSYGNIDKKLTIAALAFSKEASIKIEKAGGKAISIHDLISKNPKGNKTRIMA